MVHFFRSYKLQSQAIRHDGKTIIDFRHKRGAHCESIVTANLLSHYGMDLSEPLVFGIGSGLFFAYLPYSKLYELPLTTFRNSPGKIFLNCVQRLNLKIKLTPFYLSKRNAMNDLDQLLDRGIPTALQVGVYWLPFLPWAMRFHFNAHHLIVYGREGNEYLISDPVLAEPVRCDKESLIKARFARGSMAPRGRMFHIVSVPDAVDFAKVVKDSLAKTCLMMLSIPLPHMGVRGIRFLAWAVERWPVRFGEEKARTHLAQLIRMQEETGSGGAGFRFMYADFLDHAAKRLGREDLAEFSKEMNEIASRWRDLALVGARICKQRNSSEETYKLAALILRDCGDKEESFFRRLRKVILSRPF
jgi:hypothetical protein